MLLKSWQETNQRAKGMVKPGVLTKPEPLSLRLTRDLAGNLERVVINDGDEFDALCQAQKDGRYRRISNMPTSRKRSFLTHLIWKRRLIKR